MHTAQSLRGPRNSLAPHYLRFGVAERLLLTGHSHQAWPDVARDAMLSAFDDAAACVDDKWQRAFAKAELVREGFRRLLDDPNGEIALTENTHEAVVRFLSALPLRERRHLITTDSEFFTLRRQLGRLSEEGIELTRISAHPTETLAERLADALCTREKDTSAVLVSSVLFESAEIVPGLAELLRVCERTGSALLLDVYHQLNVVPFSVRDSGLEAAFITGGGYKYCELGEGNCFLRFPKHCKLRPVVTGWFAEFAELDQAESSARVGYADGPERFAGATYDPTSHYRGARVFEFFQEQALDVELLRRVSQHQVGTLRSGFDALDLDPELITYERSVPLERIAGFVAFRSPRAREFVHALELRGVKSDARGNVLRMGPAPYLSDGQLESALAALSDAARVMT